MLTDTTQLSNEYLMLS